MSEDKKTPFEVRSIINNESEVFANPIIDEAEYLDKELDRDLKRIYIETLKQNNNERKKYARHIFIVTCFWTAIIFAILILNGLKAWKFYLSDALLITLISTTTVNLIAFFLLVTQYLFNTKGIETVDPFHKPK